MIQNLPPSFKRRMAKNLFMTGRSNPCRAAIPVTAEHGMPNDRCAMTNDETQMTKEARMTNDQRNSRPHAKLARQSGLCSLGIRASSFFRHLSDRKSVV